MQKIIYLDNATTTYPKPEAVYQAMDNINRSMVGNNISHSFYILGQEAGKLIEETRNLILKTVKASDEAEVVLTASATLACNQILGGISWKKQDVVYVSPYEHNAVMRTLYHQKEIYGFQIKELAMNRRTLRLDLENIVYQFAKNPPSVVIMTQVSNVTGYILPISQVLALAKEYNPITIIDASQAFCLVPIALRNEEADFYIFSGHKTPCGPLGIGGFVNNHGKKLNTYLNGSTRSDSLNLKMPESSSLRYEPGILNLVAVAGLKAAMEELWPVDDDSEKGNVSEKENGQRVKILVEKKSPQKQACFGKETGYSVSDGKSTGKGFDIIDKIKKQLQQVKDLSAYMVSQLSKIPNVELYVPYELEEHVGIVAFNIIGYQSEDVARILEEDYHIVVRAGYHCAPMIHKYIPNVNSTGVVRASIGRFTTKEEVDELLRGVRDINE